MFIIALLTTTPEKTIRSSPSIVTIAIMSWIPETASIVTRPNLKGKARIRTKMGTITAIVTKQELTRIGQEPLSELNTMMEDASIAMNKDTSELNALTKPGVMETHHLTMSTW